MPIAQMTLDRWNDHVRRDADGAPLVDPLFALEMGPSVHLVDLRTPEEATGPVGFIPGSVFPDAADLDAESRRPDALPIVLISLRGVDAAAMARRLEAAGASRVAALSGGLAAWRGRGFGVSRDETKFLRDFEPLPPLLDPSQPLTVEALSRFLADPRSTHWVQLGSLNFQTTQSCVDGRDGRGVIGTPGGDAGEVALLLAAVEQATGTELSEAQVQAALISHLDAFGDFYLHTDTHALEQMRTELRADGRTAESVPDGTDAADWLAFLGDPAPTAREALLDYLSRPENLGCGHLRLQMQHPSEYGVRPELVASIIRSFFRLLWDGVPEMRPVILDGSHQEGAVVSVVQDEPLTELTSIPIVMPSWGGRQSFVNHPDVIRAARTASVGYHAAQDILPITQDQVPELVAAVEALAQRQLGETLGHLASGRGIFEARFSRDGSVAVSRLGEVG